MGISPVCCQSMLGAIGTIRVSGRENKFQVVEERPGEEDPKHQLDPGEIFLLFA